MNTNMETYQNEAAVALLDQIEHRAQAEAQGIQHRAGSAVRQSERSTSLKYCEGQLAAIERLRRLLAQSGPLSPHVVDHILRQEASHWRRLLLHHCDVGAPALPWLAYSRGGLDAIEELWRQS